MDPFPIGIVAILAMIAGFILRNKHRRALELARLETIAQKELLEQAEVTIRGLQRTLEQRRGSLEKEFNHAGKLKAQLVKRSQTLLNETHPGSFIIDRPKDGIGGDLFWVGKAENKLYLACGDTTARGVTGALIAQMTVDFLEDMVILRRDPVPSMIIEQLEQRFNGSFHVAESNNDVGESLDIALCELDLLDHRLRIAASRHDVLLARNGVLERIKGDRHAPSNGASKGHRELFDERLSPGDRIYLFSDGITNQFGGLRGKKLKCTGLMKTLENTGQLSMDETRMVLQNQLRSWMMGSDQVDDMLFVGIEIPG